MSPSILRIRCPTEYFYLTGYEDPMAQAFQEKYGRSAFDAPSDDTSS